MSNKAAKGACFFELKQISSRLRHQKTCKKWLKNAILTQKFKNGHLIFWNWL